MLDFFRRPKVTPEVPQIMICSIDRAFEMDRVITNRSLKTMIADYRQIQFGIKMGGQIGDDAGLLNRLSERIRAVLLDECQVEFDAGALIDAFVEGFPNTDDYIE